jgi:hypothetical protein
VLERQYGRVLLGDPTSPLILSGALLSFIIFYFLFFYFYSCSSFHVAGEMKSV